MSRRALRPLAVSLFVAVALAAAACGGSSTAAPGQVSTGLTYYKDVKPIFDAHCLQCHVDGGIAPFSLATPDSFLDLTPMISIAVQSKVMPPWHAEDGCTDYLDNRELSADQIATITGWVDAGSPLGDPADFHALPPIDEAKLSRVDLTLPMPVTYTQHVQPDEYRCFLLDWPGAATQFVTGFRANPGNPKVVHHVIAFLVPPDQVAEYQTLDSGDPAPGWQCFGGPGGTGRPTMLGGWAPGSLGNDFPAGTGLRVEPGSKIALQVHYNSNADGPGPDLTTIDMKIDPTVAHEAQIMPFLNPNWLGGNGAMSIPAGQPDVVHSFEYDPTSFLTGGKPFTLWSSMIHMHQLGTTGTLSILHADGTKECVLNVRDWNFHWQGMYGLAQPKSFAPGDKMHVDCHWDNTAAHQPVDANGVPRAPKDTDWGEGTTDEMCISFSYITTN